MPRPKGSKNRKTVEKAAKAVVTENLDEKLAAVQAEIDEISAQLKAKKAELKKLTQAKAEAEKAEAAKKAEEAKAAILEAVAASGKSVDEILDMLKG